MIIKNKKYLKNNLCFYKNKEIFQRKYQNEQNLRNIIICDNINRN